MNSLEKRLNYKFKNPSIINKVEKDSTFKYLAGENIFDLAKPIINGKELYPRIAIRRLTSSPT